VVNSKIQNRKLTDILLIQPPIRDFYLTSKRTVPYGLACIAAALIQSGYSVDICDALATRKSRVIARPKEFAYLDEFYGKPDISPFGLFHKFKHFGYSFEHIGKTAESSGAFLVGISALFTPYINESLKTAEAVKRFHPDCKIVLGGHHATVLPESVLQCRDVDFILRGEGEASMPILAKTVSQGKSFDSIPGIMYRNPDGSIKTSDPAVMEDLNAFPLPAIHMIRNDFYQRNNKGSTVVVSSRGCPMTCSYCSVNAASCFKYRRRSVSAVIREIEAALREDDAGFIDFEDENLALDRKWFLTLLEEISTRFKNKDLELRAMNGLYPPSLDVDVVQAMKGAGFSTLNLSLGSTDKEQLKRFQRPDVTEAFDRALRLAERFDLNAVGYIIIGAPHQSAEASLQDLLFLARRRVLAGVSVFYPSPGSADYPQCDRLGLLPHSFSLMRSTALPISHTTTRTESVTILRLGRILNFIKRLVDGKQRFPDPLPIEHTTLKEVNDRFEIGKKLLAAFFHDGLIRGVTPDGEVYAHSVSSVLAETFKEDIRKIRVQGCRTRREYVILNPPEADKPRA